MEIDWSSHERVVVLLCGPPGAGKTTVARASGLTVYDRDDPQWRGESDFKAALARLRFDRFARAVVIRLAAPSSVRNEAAVLCGATHRYVVSADQQVCAKRIAKRGRADARNTLAGLPKWFQSFDRTDGVKDFPGWPTVSGMSLNIGSTSRSW